MAKAWVEGAQTEEGVEILVEPVRVKNGELCRDACTVAAITGGFLYLRMANVGEKGYVVKEGTVLWSGTSTFSVNVATLGTRKSSDRREKKVDSQRCVASNSTRNRNRSW